MGKRRRRSEADALVGNAADPAQVETAGHVEREQREQELADMRAVLDLEAGRRVLWRLLGRCHIWESSYVSTELLQFREGERNIGLFVLGEIQDADAEQLFTMMREHHSKETSDG